MQQQFTNFLIVSIVYIVAFSLTLGFVVPLQKLLLANIPISISVLFLPHGVRVLTYYFYGWRGVLYLLPAAYLMLYLSNSSGLSIAPIAPLISLISCYVGYLAGSLIIKEKSAPFSKNRWRFFLTVGLTSSVANAIGQSILHNPTEISLSISGYVIGDMAGLMVAFYVLIMVFRWARLFPRGND
jgi:hypothetical protein